MGWIKLFNSAINLNVQTKVTPTKGNLVYEYNPFRNYRINLNMYEYLDLLYSLGDLWNNFKIGLNVSEAYRYTKNNISDYFIGSKEGAENYFDISDLTSQNVSLDVSLDAETFGSWVKEAFKEGRNADRENLEKALIKAKVNNGWYNIPDNKSDPILHEAGELCDFISDELNFSLKHPVHIIPQHSYDGSVNLIINDGLNVPRLINSRFSATGKNTYEVIDRKGNNDTNIYDQGELFDIDTSLYKRVIKIPKIDFKGITSGGNLKIGNYHFYFKLSDADGNETDFVGESGLVSVFIGFNDPQSSTTGEKNLNSYKLVNFQLTNIDSSYDYVTVYYSRTTAEGLENSVTEYAKIDKKYSVNNAEIANIAITGYENIINISPADINLNYNIIDKAYTSASCLNMLFMGNIHKPDIPYNELSDLSLRFLPYLKEEHYGVDIDYNYIISTVTKGYYDPKFIYNKTGYWGNEIYRFGIVYILKNGELSPVFNVRGNYNIKEFNIEKPQYSNIPVWEKEEGKDPERRYINYHEEKYTLLEKDSGLFENIKGVISFNPEKDTNTIYSVDFRVDDDTIQELKKLVKGYFFVRQTRIPTILAQGITIGIDKESHTPTIPTAAGFLDEFSEDDWKTTHVTTKDINDVNYISEGFLSRYTFEFKRSGGIWGWIGAVVATIALVAATVVSFGAFAPATAAGIGGIFAGLTTSVGTAIMTGTAIAAGAAVGAAVAAGAIYEGVTGIQYAINNGRAKKALNGREIKPPTGMEIVEIKDSRKLDLDFNKRFIPKDPSKNLVAGILCPDYELNQPYYNQIFTGNNHLIRLTKSLNINCLAGFSSNYFNNDGRHFYVPSYFDRIFQSEKIFKIIGVPDSVKCIGIDNMLFRAKAGEAEEAWTYECIGDNHETELDLDDFKEGENIDPKEINSDIIRGNFGAYLAFNDENNSFQPAETVNIYIPEYSVANMEEYFYLRMTDNSTFFAITDRFDIQDIDDHLVVKPIGLVGTKDRSQGYHINAYRGDCYLCLFTHRVNRNFNDPSAPYNDEIVDENTWRDNYLTDNQEKYQKINLGDVNAVLLGMWVTFKIRSSNNLNIRTLDNSYPDEEAMSGHPRGYYPYFPMSVEGTYKTPDSQIYNKGFSKSVSDRWNFEIPDVPHIKNWFGTRIVYSDIHVNDAFKNGFRVFRGTNYRDYTREYGEITKLISLESSLLCVFEHGVALIPVNERAVAGLGAGGNVYINTSNVLPENPRIISDMFGSLWPESIIKVPGKTGSSAQYVYGVDTIAKKIWRTDGNVLECISDFKVQEFLNNNITLGERELTPIIGIRNVKTHYNAFKRDVMFTFYDNTYGFEEKVWNLCWNEILEKFITFYSWVPSYMENINNIPFSFDRNTSKWVAKLGTSHAENSFADGITLSNVLINDMMNNPDDLIVVDNFKFKVPYITKSGKTKYIEEEVPKDSRKKFIGVLSLSNRILPEQLLYQVTYSLERDIYNNYDKFEIKTIKNVEIPNDGMYSGTTILVQGLYFKEGDNKSEYFPVYSQENGEYFKIEDSNSDNIYTYMSLYTPEALYTELYYRNSAGNSYADYDNHKWGIENINKSYSVKGFDERFSSKDDPIISRVLDVSVDDDKEYISNFYNQPKCWIKNIPTLNILLNLYSADTKIGNTSTKYNADNLPKLVYECTTLGEIVDLLEKENKNIIEETDTYKTRDLNTGHYKVHGIRLDLHWLMDPNPNIIERKVWYDLPIFKDITGKRPMLPKEQLLNPDKIVTLLNIKATVSIISSTETNLSDTFYNNRATYAKGSTLIDAGQYESTVAIAPKWNMQFLSFDFWKHGQAGIIDIADDIFPTYWYGKQHPFEFEVVVINDPAIHKIFTNIELIANKAKPESFHYEIIGETYDFAKDKVNMYFRQEAMKALWLYNGADITYNRNFLKVQPRQQAKSADLPHAYYARQDTINEIEDYYVRGTSQSHDYRHLSGAEIVYYPNRQEYRIWNHAQAVDIDDLNQDDSRSIIMANCHYLEDKWRININPLLVCYKNEYSQKLPGVLIRPENSTWKNPNRPPLPIINSPIPDKALATISKKENSVDIPEVLTNLGYSAADMDTSNWLSENNIYGTNFGSGQNRKELDIRDKFMKVRIRYSGEELAVIDFLNTIYRISYS